MSLKQDKIAAFPEGHSIVEFVPQSNKLLVGNAIGILKVFDTNNPDLEPNPIDILDNLTSIAHLDDFVLITNTAGHLELLNLDSKDSKVLYRSELPLRHAAFINDGKRVVCGGDDGKLVVITIEDKENLEKSATNIIALPDQLTGLAYDGSSEILSVSLPNGEIQLYSAVNEEIRLTQSIPDSTVSKVYTSMDEIDYGGAHAEELPTTCCQWIKNSEMLASGPNKSLAKFDRAGEKLHELDVGHTVIDFKVNKEIMALLTKNKLLILDCSTLKVAEEFDLSPLGPTESFINLTWSNDNLYLGTSNGVVVFLKDLAEQLPKTAPVAGSGETPEVEANSNSEALFSDNGAKGIDDSIIDASDDEGDVDDRFPYYNKDVNHVLAQRKRHKPNTEGRSVSPAIFVEEDDLAPYSPGSTPFTSSSEASRRYVTMNSTGYVWIVKQKEEQTQTITVSFFDRSVNKDYHFSDINKFDLCGINQYGILLGASNYKQGKNYGTIYYRSHESDSNSWDKKIPLSKDEFITAVSITNNEESTIVVGTNLGYLRYYNIHGLCLDILKVGPIVSIICNDKVVFVVSKLSSNLYSYSVILEESNKFLQQDCILPLKKSKNKSIPLIKGIFFNEYNDPCLVSGNDDTLIVLSNWREPKNSKWIPVLNCTDSVTEGNDMKKNWKVWPLGLLNDRLNCLLIKNQDNYPGFPLPMPIELPIKLPINIVKEEQDEESEDSLEENFIKSITMGKLVSDSLGDEGLQEFTEEMQEKLEYYTSLFDKSLLKLFANTCKAGDLPKSYSIAKLMKNDKALIAASKICQRFEFNNLAAKIGKLRDNLMELE